MLCAELLAEAGWTLGSLDGIAFGAGPGSFTGIRIACGLAQGLALAGDLPVVPVPTLAALAQSAWTARRPARVVACLDARMREVYVAAYARGVDGWHGGRGAGRRSPRRRSRGRAATAGSAPATALRAYPALAHATRAGGGGRRGAADGAGGRRARAAATRRRRGRRRRGRAAALRPPSRGADDRRARRRRAALTARRMATLPQSGSSRSRPAIEWRPLRDGDLAEVAALEAQIHAAPWTIGNFRDSLAAGYAACVGESGGPDRRLRRADASPRAKRSSSTSRWRPTRAGAGSAARCCAASSTTPARLGAEQIFLEVRPSNVAAIALYESEGFAASPGATRTTPRRRRRGRARGCAGDAPRTPARSVAPRGTGHRRWPRVTTS